MIGAPFVIYAVEVGKVSMRSWMVLCFCINCQYNIKLSFVDAFNYVWETLLSKDGENDFLYFVNWDKMARICGVKNQISHDDTALQFIFIIFRRIWNMQEKLFLQYGRFSFSFFYLTKTANSLYSKINDSGRHRTT